MIDLGYFKIDKQLYPVKCFKALDKIDVDDVLPVCPEEPAIVQDLFQLT